MSNRSFFTILFLDVVIIVGFAGVLQALFEQRWLASLAGAGLIAIAALWVWAIVDHYHGDSRCSIAYAIMKGRITTIPRIR